MFDSIQKYKLSEECDMLNFFKSKSPQFQQKKTQFRKEIRREYLDEFFRKKRQECFGWKSPLNWERGKGEIPTDRNDSDHKFDDGFWSSDIKINENTDTNFIGGSKRSQYDKKLQGMNLLQRMIIQPDSQTQHSQKSSFYDFITCAIEQLMPYIPNPFHENSMDFYKIFKQVKKSLYHKIAKQLETFLEEFVNFKNQSNINKQNAWKWWEIWLESYCKIVSQLVKWMEPHNLIEGYEDSQAQECLNESEYGCVNQIQEHYRNRPKNNGEEIQIGYDNGNRKKLGRRVPTIPIPQQVNYLIKLLIEITYHDIPLLLQLNPEYSQTTFPYDRQYDFPANTQSQYMTQLHSKFNPLINFSQDQDQLEPFSMTEYILQNTQLLQHIRYLIVFGFGNRKEQPEKEETSNDLDHYLDQLQSIRVPNNEGKLDNSESSILRQQKNVLRPKPKTIQTCTGNKNDEPALIQLICILLKNVSINVGSDFLFTRNIIAELISIVQRPLYTIEIRYPRLHPCLKSNLLQSFRPQHHYSIMKLLSQIFQCLHNEENLQQLSKINAFELLLRWLQMVGNLKQQLIKKKQNIQNYLNQQQRGQKQQNYPKGFRLGNQIQLIQDEQFDQDAHLHEISQGWIHTLAKQIIDAITYFFKVGEYQISQKFPNSSIPSQDSTGTSFASIRYSQSSHYSATNPFIYKFQYFNLDQNIFRFEFQGLKQLLALANFQKPQLNLQIQI